MENSFFTFLLMNHLLPLRMPRSTNNDAVLPWEASSVETITEITPNFSLIVWNDEVNTFEWVIETLIEICDHSPEQAEQCALFIHYKGKYAVKKGDYDILKPMCDAITERGIGATIEVLV